MIFEFNDLKNFSFKYSILKKFSKNDIVIKINTLENNCNRRKLRLLKKLGKLSLELNEKNFISIKNKYINCLNEFDLINIIFFNKPKYNINKTLNELLEILSKVKTKKYLDFYFNLNLKTIKKIKKLKNCLFIFQQQLSLSNYKKIHVKRRKTLFCDCNYFIIENKKLKKLCSKTIKPKIFCNKKHCDVGDVHFFYDILKDFYE